MANPLRRRAGLTIGVGDVDVATKANDVAKAKLMREQLVEFLVAKATVGHDAHLNPLGYDLGKSIEHLVLVVVALVLQRALVHGEPHQRRRTPMARQQRQHDRRLPVAVKLRPVHRHHDALACADDVGDPVRERLPNIHPLVR